jgi:hypothetical protein
MFAEETFSLSALLRSKSIDILKQIDIIDDNARLPSNELIARVGLEYTISSIAFDEDDSIYSTHDPHDPFDLPTCDLLDVVVAGDGDRWGETKKEQEAESFLGCGGPSRSAVKMVAQVRGRRPQRLPQSLRHLPTSTGPIKPARKLVVSSIIDETFELTKCGFNAPSTPPTTTRTKRPYGYSRRPPKLAHKSHRNTEDRLQAQCQKMSLVF